MLGSYRESYEVIRYISGTPAWIAAIQSVDFTVFVGRKSKGKTEKYVFKADGCSMRIRKIVKQVSSSLEKLKNKDIYRYLPHHMFEAKNLRTYNAFLNFLPKDHLIYLNLMYT